MPMDIGCVVLAGGRSSRMGADKAQMRIDGRRLIDVALEHVPPDWERIVVASTDLGMPTVCEDPPFGGPVAGIAAGMRHLRTSYIAVMAVDAPQSGRMLQKLADALGSNDVAVVADNERIQPLCAVWRRESLATAIAEVGARDVAAKRLFASADTVVRLPGDGTEADYDTPEELAKLGVVEFP